MDNMEAGPSGLTDEEKKKAIDSDKDAKIPEKKEVATGAIKKVPTAKFRVVYKQNVRPKFVYDIEDISDCFCSRAETNRRLTKMCEDIDMQLQVLDDFGDQIVMQADLRAKRCATQCFKHVLECCKRSGEKKLPANTKLVFADHHFDLHVPSPASEALDSQEIALLSEQLEDIDLDDDEDFPGLI